MKTKQREYPPPAIDGKPAEHGDLVFWMGSGPQPWWIVEWQPHNGSVYVIVNASGEIGTAGPEQLTRDFRFGR
jgi:hypothetical protein